MSPIKSSSRQSRPRTKTSQVQSEPGISKSEGFTNPKMAAFSRRLANDADAAHKFLVSAGIITAKGRLRKVFGG